MKKWKYLVVFSENDGIDGERLLVSSCVPRWEESQQPLKGKLIHVAFDVLGKNGWELVTSNSPHGGRVVGGVFFVFKKPLG